MSEIAEDLCITQRYLRAIEEDDLKSLPGTFFYKSFVKQYASLLGIDELPLIIEEEPLPLPGANPKYHPLREVDPIVADTNRRYFSDRRVALPVTAFFVVLLGCSGFYTWWNKASRNTQVAKQQGSTVPAIPVAAVSKTPTVDVTAEAGPDGVVLNISATERTWFSITSEGKKIFSGVLEPSQTKTLRASDVAKMKVGNAGGLDVRWNGKPIGKIGPSGQVREVLFTTEKVQILPPALPATTL